MSDQEITQYVLRTKGKLVDTNDEFEAFLYEYNGVRYVVDSANEVISQEEDNMFGPENAYFPI